MQVKIPLLYIIIQRYFTRKEPITISHRKFKDINERRFKDHLCLSFQNIGDNVMSYDAFKNNFMKIVDMHAPVKKKVSRGNNQPFMNRILSEEFMKRSKLKDDYNLNPTKDNKKL